MPQPCMDGPLADENAGLAQACCSHSSSSIAARSSATQLPSDSGAIRLEPFLHQVGGHVSMLRFDEMTICKPLNTRERKFYESMPSVMAEFTPEYRGVITVTFQKDMKTGKLTPVYYTEEVSSKSTAAVLPLPSSSQCVSSYSNSSRCTDNSRSQAASSSSTSPASALTDSGACSASCCASGLKNMILDGNIPSEDNTSASGLDDKLDLYMSPNDWNEQLLRKYRQLEDLGATKFILLENLACGFRRPCILDLKMGTRQHGDDATEAKRLGQMKKCENTTSGSLGLRICGMQVYQCNTSSYIYQSKYHGRRLNVEGVQRTLEQFLHNGFRSRRELIQRIVERLYKLKEVLVKQNTFRFYSSSLLIMYDGCSTVDDDQEELQLLVRDDGIDMLTEEDEKDDKEYEQESDDDEDEEEDDEGKGVEWGMWEGDEGSVQPPLNNVGGKTSWLPPECSGVSRLQSSDEEMNCKRVLSKSQENVGEYLMGKLPLDVVDNVENVEDNRTWCRGRVRTVDVRMIDFAHATHQGFLCDSTVHRGPDNGYLFGLQNLIKLFEEL